MGHLMKGWSKKIRSPPKFLAEILGIDLEAEQPGLDFAVEDDPMSEAELAQAMAENGSFYPIDLPSSTGVPTYVDELLDNNDMVITAQEWYSDDVTKYETAEPP